MHKLTIEDDEGKTVVVPLIRDEITVGRQEGNSIRLTERNISRRHARFYRQTGTLFVEDLGSYNGIKVNGAQDRRGHRPEGWRPGHRRRLQADRARRPPGGDPAVRRRGAVSAGARRAGGGTAPLPGPVASVRRRRCRQRVRRWRRPRRCPAATIRRPRFHPSRPSDRRGAPPGAGARRRAGRRAHHPGAHAGRAGPGRRAPRRRGWWRSAPAWRAPSSCSIGPRW